MRIIELIAKWFDFIIVITVCLGFAVRTGLQVDVTCLEVIKVRSQSE